MSNYSSFKAINLDIIIIEIEIIEIEVLWTCFHLSINPQKGKFQPISALPGRSSTALLRLCRPAPRALQPRCTDPALCGRLFGSKFLTAVKWGCSRVKGSHINLETSQAASTSYMRGLSHPIFIEKLIRPQSYRPICICLATFRLQKWPLETEPPRDSLGG